MKFLIVSQYFWPETFIINDLVATLVAQGHQIEVLTGKPNYPEGRIFPGYEADGVAEELFGSGVRVYRVPLRPRGVGGAKNLLLNYLSFVWSGIRYSHHVIQGKQYDAIFVFAPSPITAAVPAIWLKWRLRAHLAIWIQDLWPESLCATGFIRNPLLLRVVGWAVRGIYAFADTLLIQSLAFRRQVAQYAREDKIVYYPNSYRDVVKAGTSEERLPPSLLSLLDEKFCVVFAGNLGVAQSVETLVDAAEHLRCLEEIKLVLVGSGSRLAWIEAQKQEKGLDNLILAGRFSSSQMPELFCRAAGLIVTLKREEIFSYTIPSKVQAYLAAGRPVVGALDGEGARIIGEAEAGFTCGAEDAKGLARIVEQLFRMPVAERNRLAKAGRSYYLEHFEMEQQARRLVEILQCRILAK